MTEDDIRELDETINKLSVKYYGGERCVWLNKVTVEDEMYLIDLKFKEDFILKMNAMEFAKFRGEIYLKIERLFARNGCKTTVNCGSGCHGCRDKKYKVQFSEEID